MRALHAHLLAGVVVLFTATLAEAFPPFPPVKLPPVKLPPSGVLGVMLRNVPDSYYPNNPAKPKVSDSSKSLLKAALKDVREVRKDLADKDHLNLKEANQKVLDAEKIVTKESHVAHADNKKKRSAEFDAVLKDLADARRHISDHQVDKARASLKEAADGLVELTDGKSPKKDPPKKK